MGIRGLQTYIERNFPEVSVTVNLKSLTENFVKNNPGIEPVIAVDGLGCLSSWLQGVEWLYGGQFLQIKNRVAKFINFFRDQLGVTLIFFFDGLMADAKSTTWTSRRLQALAETAAIYKSLKNGEVLPVDREGPGGFPGGTKETLQRAIRDVGGSSVFLNMSGECDTTIVTYAVKHRCMAIMGHDTDFLIYDMGSLQIPYLIAYYLQFATMETKSYSRETFCRNTGVPSFLLPLFACLAGNDSTTREDLEAFHQALHVRYYRVPSRYPVTAGKAIDFVLRFLQESGIGQHQSVDGMLSRLSMITPLPQVLKNKLKDGLAVYNLAPTLIKDYPSPRNVKEPITKDSVNDDITFILLKTAMFDMMATVYYVLMFGKIERLPSLEDESDQAFSSIIYIYRPIRRRMYWLIFNFRDSRLDRTKPVYWGNTVQEVVFTTAKNSVIPDVVSPLPLRHGAPINLMNFWCDNGDTAKKQKLEAFLSVIGSTISPRRLNELPDQFKTLCVLLNYLIQDPGVPLTRVEVDAFLVQAIIPDGFNLAWIAHLEVKPITRAVHLSAIFARGIPHIMDVVSMCGEPYPLESVSNWHYFDGKRFHYCYSALTSGQTVEQLCRMQVSTLSLLTILRESTFEGINMS